MRYDIVVNVAPHHNQIANIAITYLKKFLDARNYYIFTPKNNFFFFEEKFGNVNNIFLINQEDFISGVNLETIGRFLTSRSADANRSGWYLQQFCKMAACYIPGIENYYLLWDADTIPVNQISFFSESGRVLVHPEKENHLPYFETYFDILGKKRIADFSFISGHLMVNRDCMKELICEIDSYQLNKECWVWKIMNSIKKEQLRKSGFSEFETYGNFLLEKYPETLELRHLSYYRFAANDFGLSPSKYDLFFLSKKYDYISFEAWNVGQLRNIVVHKIYAFLYYLRNFRDLAAQSSSKQLMN